MKTDNRVQNYNMTIYSLYDEQKQLVPGKPAFIFKDRILTYNQLSKKIMEICEAFETINVKAQTLVGVFIERSPFSAASLLAILKKDCIYIPLDPALPNNHIRSIINQTGVSILITGQETDPHQLVQWDFDSHAINNQYKLIFQKNKMTSYREQASFLFFTSGSTDQPKGVLHGQEQLINCLQWFWKEFPFSTDEYVAQRTTISFLPSLFEIFWGLLKGITTVIFPDSVLKDPGVFIDEIEKNKITRLRVVPSIIKMLLYSGLIKSRKLNSVKYWITAGEPFPAPLYRKFKGLLPDTQLLNDYGSTETNTICFFSEKGIEKNLNYVPVGKPIGNVRVYILDNQKNPVPAGIPGEIHVSGAGLAKKYFNNEELTKNKFIDNKFDSLSKKLYNTGDFGRYLPGNNIEYIGRIDDQVKIRGNRVDLSQIEEVLSKHKKIKESAVVSQKDQNDQNRIYAFVVLKEDIPINTIRKFLMERLPDYMLPAYIIPVDSIPLTVSGKKARQALLQMAVHYMKPEHKGLNMEGTKKPAGGFEKVISEIVSSLLDIKLKVGDVNEPFKNLGIDSVLIVALSDRLAKALDKDISVTTLFDYPTIKELSDYLTRNYGYSLQAGNKLEIDGYGFEIAVIGVSGQFPGAESIQEFWHNLVNGVSSIMDIPPDRFPVEQFFDENINAPNKTNSKQAGLLKNAQQFEPLFFHLSNHEVTLMDPQQRLSLMESWRTIEDAGYSPKALQGKRVGVFIGARNGDYIQRIQEKGIERNAHSLMGNDPAILAGRNSYFFNLKGPAITINTACSSSLVAIHLACQSIMSGECSMALAGGVCILSSHDFFIETTKIGMFSPDAKCKTFDNDADGFVAGEAAAFILLKPLKTAIKDNDHIYGIIKASSINQDGKTNGITAPNTLSQVDVELSVYKKAGINPESIGYVEAHGTGTKLGDPVEIAALTEVFRKFTCKRNFCAVGSVKTNIGHTGAAAGIAGFIKALLSLKYKKLVPSLNIVKENELIDFKDSPFYVNKKPADWDNPLPTPRRACVSSFGFSGTNAHVLLEEYINTDSSDTAGMKPFSIIPLSARTTKSLNIMQNNLLEWLKNNKDASLPEIAYTLQTGRNHFTNRGIFIASDIDDLIQKLSPGTVLPSYDIPAALKKTDCSSVIQQINTSCSSEFKENLERLARCYMNGDDIKWQELYSSAELPRRISLPNYPFNTRRFWIDIPYLPGKMQVLPEIRPVLDTSIASQHCFFVKFFKADIVVSQHLINNQPVLPGVVLIEMAGKAAGEITKRSAARITDFLWLSPVFFYESEIIIYIDFLPCDDCLDFTIYSIPGNKTNETKKVHATGRIPPEKQHGDAITYNIRQMMNEFGNRFPGEDIYAYYTAAGISYGPAFQCTQSIHINKQYDKIITHIILPAEQANNTGDDYFPVQLFDAVLHSVSFLGLRKKNGKEEFLPFSIESIEFFELPAFEIYVYGELKELSDQHMMYNLDILNNQGKVLASLCEFVLKRTSKKQYENQNEKIYFYKNVFHDAPLSVTGIGIQKNVLLFDCNENLFSALKDNTHPILVLPGEKYKKINDHIYTINPLKKEEYEIIIDELLYKEVAIDSVIYFWTGIPFQNVFSGNIPEIYRIFPFVYLVQVMMFKEIQKLQLFYMFEKETHSGSPLDAAVKGFMKTLYIERPGYKCKVIATAEMKNRGKLKDVVLTELNHESDQVEILDLGQMDRRKKEQLVKLDFSLHTSTETILKQNGVYLITGGLGGLGVIFAAYFSKTVHAHLILTGRSVLNESKKQRIKQIKSCGGTVEYIQNDVSSLSDVKKLHKYIRRNYHELNGIIHSAGVVRDSFILRKTDEEIKEVFAPKISGSYNLVKTFLPDNLDFFVLFSSLAAEEGLAGQADYGYANSFIDHLARENNIWSIKWGLWDNGGLKMQAGILHELRKRTGIIPISDENGIAAFLSILANPEKSVVAVAREESQQITRTGDMDTIPARDMDTIPASTAMNINITPANLQTQAEYYFIIKIAEETKIPVAEIKPGKPLEYYGIDSIMILSLTYKLEKDFGPLSKTIFFENKTIKEVADYFCRYYQERLKTILSVHLPANHGIEKEKETLFNNPIQLVKNSDIFLEQEIQTQGKNHEKNRDCAIIGLNGIYPKAVTIEEFWQNLVNGLDCITGIPADRWDYKENFTDDAACSGKNYSKWGGFLKDIDKFDPVFFKISPKEAQKIDPQERLFLEVVWHTFEDAGYTRKSLSKNNVGVFVGVMWGQYHFFGIEQTMKGNSISLNSSFASIANRVSYVFDFHGPSMAVDTMCSSSLTAIHLACESIISSECDMAVAGGVNLSLHPDKYLSISEGGFASRDGRCRSFGKGGSGYVPGEGVGAILIKSLDKAITDNDHIYAIIKGTAINHGGKTNGYTVPDPVSQEKLLLKAFNISNISPGTIGYIEAHGTGTALGDPVEIAGLANAFRGKTDKCQFCSIGSVKSNIGHLEGAAGIAGVTKVILQLNHKTLVPSLHSKETNEYIDFSTTPFFIQQECTEWKKLSNTENEQYPRRAGISAFGAGGANAHILIEEYETGETGKQVQVEKEDALFVLSAKDSTRLEIYVQTMIDFLRKNCDELNKQNFVFTLQTGREQLEARLAVIFNSFPDLINSLMNFLNKTADMNLFYTSDSSTPGDILFEGDAGTAFIYAILKQMDLRRIASVWITGIDIDWSIVYADMNLKRISIPGYPFEKERYWVPGIKTARAKVYQNETGINLFITKNISDFYEQKYLSRFTGDEYFLKDHLVNKQKYLPASVLIEIASAAGKLAGKKNIRNLKKITLKKAFIIEETEKDLVIKLMPDKNSSAFSIYSSAKDDSFECTSGYIEFYPDGDCQIQKEDPIDINELRTLLPNTRTQNECYEQFNQQGITYGPAFQTIKMIYYNDNAALGHIILPDNLVHEPDGTVINPVILDGAFQSVSALLPSKSGELYIPYSIEEISIFKPLEPECFALAKKVDAGCSGLNDTFDINIVNRDGNILVRIKCFSLMKMKTGQDDYSFDAAFLYLTERWEEKPDNLPVVHDRKGRMNILLLDNTHLLEKEFPGEKFRDEHYHFVNVTLGTCYNGEKDHYEIDRFKSDDYITMFRHLLQEIRIDKIIYHNEGAVSDFSLLMKEKYIPFFNLVAALLQNKLYKTGIFILSSINVQNRLDTIFDDSLNGFYRSLMIEHSSLRYKIITISDIKDINEIISFELHKEDYNQVLYKDGKRYVRTVNEISLDRDKADPGVMIKNDRTYLITGGAGGIGLKIAGFISRKNNKARILLSGRSPLSSGTINEIENLRNEFGNEIDYFKADITDFADLEKLRIYMEKNNHKAGGIIHCAGIHRDALFINKKNSEMIDVLKPKVAGTLYIDSLCKDMEIDFFILFSSVASILGNTGQTDYAAANRFMDGFCSYREELRQKGKRSGKTISINWPLWENGGMNITKKQKQMMKEETGTIPIIDEEAMSVFTGILNNHTSQVIIVKGNKDRLLDVLNERYAYLPESYKEKGDTFKPGDSRLEERIIAFLRGIFADELKLSPGKVNIHKTFDNYGMDSLNVINLNKILGNEIRGLSQSLFYEYNTLYDLCGYFLANHSGWAAKKIGDIPVSSSGQDKRFISTSLKKESLKISNRFLPEDSSDKIKENGSQDIAIIGISGKYPMAENLEQFWNNLKNGKDCIDIIPRNRWDYVQYFSGEKGIPGKSYSKWGGFLSDIDKFDSLFFNISPGEAELMDPQERLFLETAWHTVEDGGYSPGFLSRKKTGVFIGVMWGLYQLYGAEEMLKNNYIYPNSSFASIANRVSYCLNLSGPSIALDTMCSSSVAAIHLACESLKQGECKYAIAGAVNLSLHPYKYLALSENNFVSEDGRCRSFGKNGSGYAPGEGVGAVLLKLLPGAVADKDHIYAVIKATSINHGGKTSGFTVPNPRAQAEIILQSIKKSGINPNTISYIETHGAGTELGDPIEIAGLEHSIGKYRERNNTCPIGSVKSNIGHLEAAAGIAGLTKIVLQMQNKELVPSLYSKEVNPNIDFKKTIFRVQQENMAWERPVLKFEGEKKQYPLLANISSFGAGGSNGNIIVEEFIQPHYINPGDLKPAEYLFILSARNEERLHVYIKIYIDFLSHIDDSLVPSYNLKNITYTLQTGREALEQRMAVKISTKEELIEKLSHFRDGKEDIPGLFIGNAKTHFSRFESLLEGKDGLEFFRNLVKNNNLSKLGNLWVSGIEIDWDELYEDNDVFKVSLPGYPFLKETHWIKISRKTVEQDPANKARNQVIRSMKKSGSESEFFELLFGQITGVLKLDKTRISPDTEVGSIGFNSILLLRLLNKLNQAYNVKISPLELQLSPQLKIKTLIDRIIKRIDGKENNGDKGKEPVVTDTQEETKINTTKLFPSILDLSHTLTIKNIFLTGATGVLGGRLLKELLLMTDCRIYCLVRTLNDKESKQKLLSMLAVHDPEGALIPQFHQRVIPVAGDLLLPHLGLDTDLYRKITGEIDVILHCAARVSLSGLYDEVKPLNVDGTKHIVDFALNIKQKYLIFISTHGVMGDRWLEKCMPFTEKDLDLHQGFEGMGYQKSKFDAEVLVRMARKRGLKWIIIRTGNIMGDSQSGYYPLGITSTTGIYYDLLKTAIHLKYAPDTPLYFDITPLDYLSKSIVFLGIHRRSIYETYHVTNPDYKRLVDFYTLIRQCNYDIKILPHDQYYAYLDTLGESGYLSVFIELVKFNPSLGKSIKDSSYADNEYTTSILTKNNILCHKIDEELINTYIGYCIKKGYFA